MKHLETKHDPVETSTGYIYGTTRIQAKITHGPNNVMGRTVTTFLSWESVKAIAVRSARTDPARITELVTLLETAADAPASPYVTPARRTASERYPLTSDELEALRDAVRLHGPNVKTLINATWTNGGDYTALHLERHRDTLEAMRQREHGRWALKDARTRSLPPAPMLPPPLFRAAVAAGLTPPADNTHKLRRLASGIHARGETSAAQSIAAAVRGDRDGMHELAQKLAALPDFRALDGPLDDPLEEIPTFD